MSASPCTHQLAAGGERSHSTFTVVTLGPSGPPKYVYFLAPSGNGTVSTATAMGMAPDTVTTAAASWETLQPSRRGNPTERFRLDASDLFAGRGLRRNPHLGHQQSDKRHARALGRRALTMATTLRGTTLRTVHMNHTTSAGISEAVVDRVLLPRHARSGQSALAFVRDGNFRPSWAASHDGRVEAGGRLAARFLPDPSAVLVLLEPPEFVAYDRYRTLLDHPTGDQP
ncbi:hypothetical protein OG898_11420 [Streptomyces sp. NBC_00193]|uniref:hypothetical protein n=1 Tax=Streptomyces sp. NBC_00193 TaxID=2975675 RepID=UPI00224E9689|nr:hypothetical protein [Streptomyces sp. NBC_00193]MCX5297099.1 hypothetical protein [Streptomyces sp. NBC_00193]